MSATARVLLLIAVVFVAGFGPSAPAAGDSTDVVDRRWLQRLDELDRALLDDLVGYAPPPFTPELTWVGGDGMAWPDLRGKVVLLHSWSHATTAGRGVPRVIERALPADAGDAVQVILLQTPDGTEGLQRFLEKREIPWPIAVDPTGSFCDDLGVYRKPVNVLVDRHGDVRYAGLNDRGLREGLKVLVAEAYDEQRGPRERPQAEAPAAPPPYPEITGEVAKARDVRGQRAPDFFVQRWITPRPDPVGKVVIIDFWATWCGPCVNSIPHMNELADAFRGDVVVVGVSQENSQEFAQGMRKLQAKRGLSLNDFRYAIAIDDQKVMSTAIGNQAIPHCLVMSADWVVRWQGHPASLTKDVLGQIVEANRAGTPVARPARPRRWTRS